MTVFIPASASVRVLRQRLNGSEAVLDPMLEFPDKKRQSLLGGPASSSPLATTAVPAPLATCPEVTNRQSSATHRGCAAQRPRSERLRRNKPNNLAPFPADPGRNLVRLCAFAWTKPGGAYVSQAAILSCRRGNDHRHHRGRLRRRCAVRKFGI
ncbi:hypothetical protein [Bradyrhizobium japonicum]|uniref:hypothetical protein n=1 Tax=Bradyrhizobium japonicum TaxID=375 RepID=UPI00271541D8|nr:hypothetical protein [Bradyrhizobium japonicum]WLB24464.1 hypothetical protein QIH95_48140 [Bradyrhizobium japonicum]